MEQDGSVDRDNTPTAPAAYRGLGAIGGYNRDICGRNMEHSVEDLVSTDDGLGYTQRCRYPDGTRVVCVTVARLLHGKITRQTVVQVWDAPDS